MLSAFIYIIFFNPHGNFSWEVLCSSIFNQHEKQRFREVEKLSEGHTTRSVTELRIWTWLTWFQSSHSFHQTTISNHFFYLTTFSMNVNNSLRPPKSHPWFIEQHFTCHDIEFPAILSLFSECVLIYLYLFESEASRNDKIIQMCSDSVYPRIKWWLSQPFFSYSLFLFILPGGFQKVLIRTFTSNKKSHL